MKKKIKATIALAGVLCLSAGTTSIAASDADLERLQQQIQVLISQNRQLTKRVAILEKHQTSSAETVAKSAEGETEIADDDSHAPHGYTIPEKLLRTRVQQIIRKEMRAEQEKAHKEQRINDYVTLFGTIEGEAVIGEDYEGDTFSEFNMSEATLGFDAQMSNWVTGHLVAKYEGPDDNLFMDEANIWLGNQEKFPLLMTAGKFYMPFGDFDTHMVQDPLTLEIGEINDYGVGAGYLGNGFHVALYVYNGIKETDASDTITGFGAKAGYEFENDTMNFKAGISWVNNIADSGGISDYLEESGLDTIKDQVNGLGMNLFAAFGPVSFIGEYVLALDDFAEIAYRDQRAEPEAWSTELAYSSQLFDKEFSFAVGCQGSSEAVELGLPETRYITAASMIILPGTALTLEYCHDEDYSIEDGGTDEDANVFTTQLSYEF